MNILEKWFYEANKIIKFKSFLPFALLILILIIASVIWDVVYRNLPNEKYKTIEIRGKVNEIKEIDNNRYFKINGTWYLIKSNYIDYLKRDYYIFKEEDSYSVTIYDNNNNTMYLGVEKSVEVKKMSDFFD